MNELNTKGFKVIRSFLDQAEILLLMRDYLERQQRPNLNYATKSAGPECLAMLAPKVLQMAELVRRETGINVNAIESGLYFSTSVGKGFDWHQDHESYYLYQDHSNYLNFYIPISKPDKTASNLSLIPFDSLAGAFPEVAEERRGKGASRLFFKNEKTFVVDDEAGKITRVRRRLDELCVTPELEQGDLLLMRGDLFHKSQDGCGDRVSVSVRMLNGEGAIRRSDFFKTCPAKDKVISNNPETFELLKSFFNSSGADEISIEEFLHLKSVALNSEQMLEGSTSLA